MPKNSKKKEVAVKKPSSKIIKEEQPSQMSLLGSSDLFDGSLGESIPADNETDLMLSKAILKIAEPLIEKCDKHNQHIKTIIALTVAAWNLTLIPKKYYDSAIKHTASNLPMDTDFDQIESLLANVFNMVHRKIQYYHNVKMYIDKCEIVETENGWTLKVVSIINME
jgi:hypothetical protein